jgi:hypothetical protein
VLLVGAPNCCASLLFAEVRVCWLCVWALCVLPGFVLESARALCVGSLLCIPRGLPLYIGSLRVGQEVLAGAAPYLLVHLTCWFLLLIGREVLAGCLLRLSVRLALAALCVVRCGSVHDECIFCSAHCVYLV